MFLPVLLIRDFGAWAFVVFAVPNVVGAGAMGWVLRRPGAAGKLLEQHQAMVRAFSEVTITFQLFGMMMFLFMGVGVSGWRSGFAVQRLWPWIALGVMSIVVLLAFARSRLEGGFAVLTWLASAALLACIAMFGPRTGLAPAVVAPSPPLGLIMVCVFGFALCPYLDRTFLRASRMQSAGDSTVGFGLGFGFFFLAMIAGTVAAMPLFAFGDRVSFVAPTMAWAFLYFTHVLLQVDFTVAAHADRDAIRAMTREQSSKRGLWAGLGAFLFTILIPNLEAMGIGYAGLSLMEITYRGFLAFYGLVFPAYVWLCMVPNWTRGPASRWQWRVWLGACLAAAPMYWMGFIERETWWLVPGVGLVLAARVLVGRGGDTGRTGEAPPSQTGFVG